MNWVRGAVSIFLALVIFVRTVGAVDREVKIGDQHPGFNYLEQSEHAFIPFIGAVMGFIVAADVMKNVPQGKWIGAATGLVVCGVDEALVYWGYWDQHHLTYGLIGSAIVGQVQTSYYLSHITGVILGVMKSLDLLNAVEEYSSAPIDGLIHGSVYQGAVGGVGGLIAGGVDEVLVRNNVTAQPYLTNAVMTLAQAKVVMPLFVGIMQGIPVVNSYKAPYVLLFLVDATHVGILVIAYQMYNGIYGVEGESSDDDAQRMMSPSQAFEEIAHALEGVTDKEELNNLLEQQQLILMTTKLILLSCSKVFLGYLQNFNVNLASLKNVNTDALVKTNRAMVIFFGFLVPYIGFWTVSDLLKNYYQTLITQAVEDEIKSQYYSGEMPLKLSIDSDAARLVTSMNENIETLTSMGSYQLSCAVRAYVLILGNSFYMYSNHALDFIVLLNLYNDWTQAMTIYLNADSLRLKKDIQEIEGKIATLEKSVAANAKAVVMGDKVSFVDDKRKKWVAERRQLDGLANFNEVFTNIWRDALGLTKFAINNGFMVYKIGQGEVNFDHYEAVVSGGVELTESYSWYSQNADEVSKLLNAIDSLNQLLEKIHNATMDPRNTLSYENVISDQYGIIADGLTVGIQDWTLLNSQIFRLEKGVYSFQGDSGSGKSTIISKLKGIHFFNGSFGAGSISYLSPDGKNLKVCVVAQDDYLAPNSTLWEVILSKTQSEIDQSPELKERVLELLREIHIDAEGVNFVTKEIDLEKDWGATLSGGQKKKVAIIWAIMQDPDVLFLDEVFVGLDEDSIRTAQRMIKKYLKDKIILINDHKAHTNNYYNFFDGEFRLKNQALEFLRYEDRVMEIDAN